MNAPHHSDWQTPPPGALERLQRKLTLARSRKRLGSAVALTSLLCLLVAGGYYLRPKAEPAPLARLGCREVHDLLPKYVHQEVAGDLRTRIDEHLRDCKKCREELARFHQQNAPAQHGANLWHLPTPEDLDTRRLAAHEPAPQLHPEPDDLFALAR